MRAAKRDAKCDNLSHLADEDAEEAAAAQSSPDEGSESAEGIEDDGPPGEEELSEAAPDPGTDQNAGEPDPAYVQEILAGVLPKLFQERRDVQDAGPDQDNSSPPPKEVSRVAYHPKTDAQLRRRIKKLTDRGINVIYGNNPKAPTAAELLDVVGDLSLFDIKQLVDIATEDFGKSVRKAASQDGGDKDGTDEEEG
jgi:hypothetical protein